MDDKKGAIFLVVSVLLLVTLACGFSVSTAKIADVQMAKDEEGTQPTTTFAPEDTFYANVELTNAPDDTRVKAVWTAVEVEDENPDTLIDETEIESGSGTLYFNLTNSGPWPVGKYKVDIYLNDELDRTIEFSVQ